MNELTVVERFILEVLHDPERRERFLELCYKEGFRETEPDKAEQERRDT